MYNNLQDIPLELLDDNPYEKRKKYGDIENLASSIERRGLQHPISVVKVGERFTIVSGHRRVHAYRYLGRKKIPAFIRKESTPSALAMDLAIENLQRKDLLPAEKGATIAQLFFTIPSVNDDINRVLALVHQVGTYKKKNRIGSEFSEEDIIRAEKFLDIVGLSSGSAIRYVRLCLLPMDIQEKVVSLDRQDAVQDGIIAKSAYELTRIKDEKIQRELYEKAKIGKDGIKHLELKNIVDKLVEDDSVARKTSSSSAKRRSEDDSGAEKLIEEIRELSPRVAGIKSRIPIMVGRMEKAQWLAMLEKMRKACSDLIVNINSVIRENMKMEGLETVDMELEINITAEMRYKFPSKVARVLNVKEGDTLLVRIEGIKRTEKPDPLPILIDI